MYGWGDEEPFGNGDETDRMYFTRVMEKYKQKDNKQKAEQIYDDYLKNFGDLSDYEYDDEVDEPLQ